MIYSNTIKYLLLYPAHSPLKINTFKKRLLFTSIKVPLILCTIFYCILQAKNATSHLIFGDRPKLHTINLFTKEKGLLDKLSVSSAAPFGFKIFLEVVQSFVAVFHEFGKTLLKRKIGRIAATPIYFLRFGGLGNRFFRV